MMVMVDAASICASQARDQFGELCNRVAYGGERIKITHRNKARVALVSAEDLELLRAVEDVLDVAAARTALREKATIQSKTSLEI